MKKTILRIVRAWTADYSPPITRRAPSTGWLRDKFHIFQTRRRVRKLLDGRPKEDVLEKAPYRHGWFQGDNAFRIMDDRKAPPFIHFVRSIEEAELWILERYLCELNGLPIRDRGFYEDLPKD